MSESTRRSYVSAVRCLQNTPTQISASDQAQWPGVLSRYDEYVFTHVNMTLRIRFTVSKYPQKLAEDSSSSRHP